jgi:hypothetical protein
VKTRVTGTCIREPDVSETKPLRFCDLEVGDVFRWVNYYGIRYADREDAGELRQKVSCVSYRYLTATATVTVMATERATAVTEKVERYDIEINLHNPCRVRQE